MSQTNAGKMAQSSENVEGLTSETTRLGEYLRRLREGYGYTLRKVEERAMALGEAIDNSQLSRFEKGKAVPSFDKLRALARVFNVPVQNFSDVLDLEEYQPFKPTSVVHAELLRDGADWMARGEHGRAFVTYERAFDLAEREGDPVRAAELAAEARWRMATALKALGKLYMTERELRAILKDRKKLAPHTRIRVLLQLSYLYRELGDYYLASVLARECLELAEGAGDRLTQAGVLNTLGNIAHDEEEPVTALDIYNRALDVLQHLDGHHEMKATVLTNLGGCHVTVGRFDEGIALLREAHSLARDRGFRRSAALSLTRMAEAHMARNEHGQARQILEESDLLANRTGDCYYDMLFLNAHHRWKMAQREEHPTREKIAFGRLRHLRSMLQRRFPEVEEFDQHIERIRR
ncbi:MAG: tetratricopeptide repeat protein [Acidobacteriota bacterium]|nr:tetratricopeptide repeat protein [Acidobacteriota bacterium]MDH3784229.1 tetratricopeptide repeat protein [Acidobacteriota bacterium]